MQVLRLDVAFHEVLLRNISARTLEKVVCCLNPSACKLTTAASAVKGLGVLGPALSLRVCGAEARAFHRSWSARARTTAALGLARMSPRRRASQLASHTRMLGIDLKLLEVTLQLAVSWRGCTVGRGFTINRNRVDRRLPDRCGSAIDLRYEAQCRIDAAYLGYGMLRSLGVEEEAL